MWRYRSCVILCGIFGAETVKAASDQGSFLFDGNIPGTNEILLKLDLDVLRRQSRSTTGIIPCIHMQSTPGELQYISDGNQEVCGLYLIGEPNQLVEIEFVEFNVRCETGGLLAVFDGWELQGEIFPDLYDHQLPMHERYTTFCGEHRPAKLYMASQNVALLQFHLPAESEGFKVIVNFKNNPQPCNAVAMFEMGLLTMKNYGLRRNCSTSIIYPEQIQLINVDVGVTSEVKKPEAETGLSDKQCMNFAGGDYIQLMNGHGLDTSLMATKGVFCGLDSDTEKDVTVTLGCQHSVVRLVSSGEFYNTVTFQYAPPTPEAMTENAMC